MFGLPALVCVFAQGNGKRKRGTVPSVRGRCRAWVGRSCCMICACRPVVDGKRRRVGDAQLERRAKSPCCVRCSCSCSDGFSLDHFGVQAKLSWWLPPLADSVWTHSRPIPTLPTRAPKGRSLLLLLTGLQQSAECLLIIPLKLNAVFAFQTRPNQTRSASAKKWDPGKRFLHCNRSAAT